MTEAIHVQCPHCGEGFPLQAPAAVDRDKAEALDRLADTAGALCLTDAAKVLGARPKQFVGWLILNGWIYRRPSGALSAIQRRIDDGSVRQKIVRLPQTDGTMKVVEQVLINPAGLTRLAQAMGREAA